MRGFTVELSFLMPMILFLIMGSILGAFYYHDKNIIIGAVYETVVVGGTKGREKEGGDAGELEELFYERVGDKCILFAGAEMAATMNQDEVKVEASASGRGMSVSVSRNMPVTCPENKIRDVRRIEKLGNGTKNNN